MIGHKYGCLTVINVDEQNEGQYLCQCKCGQKHSFNEKTIQSCPKYCSYPVFISSRDTYSVRARNATYRKRMKYKDLMNVHLVNARYQCGVSNEYCELWNRYKEKQSQRASDSKLEKKYTVSERDSHGVLCRKRSVLAISHLDALKKLYPNDVFELCVQTGINRPLILDYDVRVENHYGCSTQMKVRLYRRVKKKEL